MLSDHPVFPILCAEISMPFEATTMASILGEDSPADRLRVWRWQGNRDI